MAEQFRSGKHSGYIRFFPSFADNVLPKAADDRLSDMMLYLPSNNSNRLIQLPLRVRPRQSKTYASTGALLDINKSPRIECGASGML
jgi:hypothetical protein